jgi:hypothetical protein
MTLYTKLRELSDVTVGNDKTVATDTEPIGNRIEIVVVKTIATSTAGTRSVDLVLLTDEDVELARLADIADNTQGTTQTDYIYSGSADGELPPIVLRPGYKIQAVDTADIDVLDTIELTVHMEGTDRIG